MTIRYASDRERGIRRQRVGKGFRYVSPDDRVVRDRATLARIRSLAIPPAWKDVWIAPDADAHLQATGRDARGRKQYRYHPEWRAAREATKYEKVIAFGRALPRIRARVARDLRRKGVPREKVLAVIVRLLDATYLRVGNDEYRRENGSYGLTTLRDQHARVRGDKVSFRFRGKAGKLQEVELEHPRLARIVKRCQDLPGQDLFQYVDDEGEVRDVTSQDVNDYLREAGGGDFTAKDFRTWAGTVLASVALREVETFDSEAEAKRNVVAAIEKVAKELGNTPAVCRKCYVHPDVLQAYLDGTFVALARKKAAKVAQGKLGPDEAAVLALLRRRLAPAKRRGRKTKRRGLEPSVARPRAKR